MPRPDKMTRMTIEEDKVFYWPDTGPVQYTTSSGKIIKAQMVDEDHSWLCHTDEEEHQRVHEILTDLTHQAEDLGLYK